MNLILYLNVNCFFYRAHQNVVILFLSLTTLLWFLLNIQAYPCLTKMSNISNQIKKKYTKEDY